MFVTFFKFLFQLLRRFLVGVFIAALLLSAWAFWLYKHDDEGFVAQKSARLAALEERLGRWGVEQRELLAQAKTLGGEADQQRARAERADKVAETLRDAESTWERFLGNREQQLENDRRLARMIALAAEARGLAVKADRERTEIEAQAARLAVRLQGATDARLTLTYTDWPPVFYLLDAWDRGKWFLAAAFALGLLGPAIVKFILFYGLGRMVARASPLRIAHEFAANPEVTPSATSLEMALWPGEILRVRRGYLTTRDDVLRERRRAVLNWRIPFASFFSGLVALDELRNARAGDALRVSIAHPTRPDAELAVVSVPEGASLVLSPRHLAGVVSQGDEPVMIGRRWRFFSWQAWVALQFRFFEFVGPCRLLVVSPRGLRAEVLAEAEGQGRPLKRVWTGGAVAFTPNLELRPARTERFRNYLFNGAPLFEEQFSGYGLVLVQGSRTAAKTKLARLASRTISRALRVFGL